MSAPRFLTVEQCAELLQLDRFTIYKWIAHRRLPVIRLSARALRIRASDVEAFLAANLQRADPRFALDGLPDDAVEERP